MNLKVKNHFVPRCYLKNFSKDGNKIWNYELLVPNSKFPEWKLSPIINKAYRKYLYISTIAGKENDDLEDWFNQEIETPASKVISKVVNNSRISKSDWGILIKFFALQYVRTPAYYIKIRSKLKEIMPYLRNTSFRESIQKIESREAYSKKDYEIKSKLLSTPIHLPFKVTKNVDKNKDLLELQAEILQSRETWIFQIRRALINTFEILNQHRWTILCPPENMSFVTSDNPVIQLNCNDYNDYNLSGAWGSKGTDLILPLSPKHLLYTQVGKKVPPKGTKLPLHQFKLLQKIIAESAHRTIFADQENIEINKFRKREVNLEKYNHERQEWIKWHEEQTIAELDFA